MIEAKFDGKKLTVISDSEYGSLKENMELLVYFLETEINRCIIERAEKLSRGEK